MRISIPYCRVLRKINRVCQLGETTMTPNLQTPTLQHPDLAPQKPQTSQYPAEVANFNLLAARNRTSERSPHYFGSFKIQGVWYQVSTWIVFSRNGGEQQLSNSIRPCTPEEAAKHEARDQQFQAGQQARAQQTLGQVLNPMHAPANTGAPAVDTNHPF